MKTGEDLAEQLTYWCFQTEEPCGIVLNWQPQRFSGRPSLLGWSLAENYYIFCHTMEVQMDSTRTSATLHDFYPMRDC